jgi:hypothetical protein
VRCIIQIQQGEQMGLLSIGCCGMAPLFRTLYGGAKGWLEDLKLRASFGNAGNNNIPSGQLVQSSNRRRPPDQRIFQLLGTFQGMANPDLKWETTVTATWDLTSPW